MLYNFLVFLGYVFVHMKDGCYVTSVNEEYETTCWGCGSHLLLSSYSPIFKCGWCGAITNQNPSNCENKGYWWGRFLDWFFICVLSVYVLFVICGGVWAVYPVVFSTGYIFGIFHSIVILVLSVTTISTFSLAAFQCAGAPQIIPWGSYSAVGKGGLENYTFCQYCSKPKSPRTHHCRSCRMCILDMDHHCPFVSMIVAYHLLNYKLSLDLADPEAKMIGNCVGAANHRSFIAFLISAVISTFYVSIMSAYAELNIWPPLKYRSLDHFNSSSNFMAWRTMEGIFLALLRSAVFDLSARGLVLLYLFVSSVVVEIGLIVLLWQQLCFISEGDTYLSHLSSQGSDAARERNCQNFLCFFGFPPTALHYLPRFWQAGKRHKK
ncbi:protein S-acyltransferase [Sarracenia purpurea var. burkii]